MGKLLGWRRDNISFLYEVCFSSNKKHPQKPALSYLQWCLLHICANDLRYSTNQAVHCCSYSASSTGKSHFKASFLFCWAWSPFESIDVYSTPKESTGSSLVAYRDAQYLSGCLQDLWPPNKRLSAWFDATSSFHKYKTINYYSYNIITFWQVCSQAMHTDAS